MSRPVTDPARLRTVSGLNHLAFHAGDQATVDGLVCDATSHGWTLMFVEKHPYAGGPDTYAAYLANSDGYEIELVADDPIPE